MNDDIKNILSFIKEALELKNKNIYSVNDYDKHYDLKDFYTKYQQLVVTVPESTTIFDDEVIFKIKYISSDKKKKCPVIPSSLKKYIELDENNNIVEKMNIESYILEDKEYLNNYNQYQLELQKVKDYNNLINNYNQVYMDLYNVYKRINEFEEKIEIVFGTNLLVWKNPDGELIKRYALEANLNINVNPQTNTITLSVDQNSYKGFVIDFFNLKSFQIKDYVKLVEFIKKFNEDEREDYDKAAILNELNVYLNYACVENKIVDGEYKANEIIKNNILYAFNNTGIIVRNKNIKLWIEDLKKIILECDTEKITSPILNLMQTDFDDELKVKELLYDSSCNKEIEESDILFPLPANKEQYNIVEKVNKSNIVLVQGPPGTGKSHTIANLLSYYISQGKKVIVTSEKAKALEVLRNKIPESIRSLSLAILNNTGVDKDLEYSIETIKKRYMSLEEKDTVSKSIKNNEEKLKNVQEKKRKVSKNIIELMQRDTISHRAELNGIMEFEKDNSITLMDLAIWLEKNRKNNYIPLDDTENYDYINLDDFFAKLDDVSNEIKNNKYALNRVVPILPTLKTNEYELSIEETIKIKNYISKDTNLQNSIRQKNISKERIDSLTNEFNKLNPLYSFFNKLELFDNSNYNVFNKSIEKIIELIKSNKKLFDYVEESLIDYSFQYNKLETQNYLYNIQNMVDLYDDDGKINFLNKIKLNSKIKEVNGIFVNDIQINKNNITKEILSVLVKKIKYDNVVSDISKKIQTVLNYDLIKELNIDYDYFGKHSEKVVNILDSILNYKKIVNKINDYISEMINTNLYNFDYISLSENDEKNIINELKYYNEIKLNKNKNNVCVNELRDYYKDYNLQNLNFLCNAIETLNVIDTIKYKNELLNEINIINNYNSIRTTFDHFMNDKKNFVSKYIYYYDDEDKAYIRKHIHDIMKYHYINKYYVSLESINNDLPKLYEEREALNTEEKSIITKLIELKGWFYQNDTMTSSVNLSLGKWLNLKKKLGGGHGKKANMILRQMRVEMAIAKYAIPVWIMPLDKLIEQYPYSNNPDFDVLIMDESSQSSIYSVTALARAKKVVIVGDDKQISPTNAFQSIQNITNLKIKYLKGNQWDLLIDRDVSIYDFVQMICKNNKICLSEHFRCLPEIIHYSNKEFYNMQINPLKVRGKNETIIKPLKEIYVEGAYVTVSGNKLYNELEVNKIISIIDEISKDKQYNNKTIGIIALQDSDKYINKINEMLMNKFGGDFIKERKIKVGNTYDFQGDERDVIILGMLVAPVEKDGTKKIISALTKKEYERSYNVAASRAKEQMILVHSVTLEDLNPNCNRYKLLEYFMNYDNEQNREITSLFESNFEKDIYYCLKSKQIDLIPQYKVGNYRIDFVINCNNNQKIALECDGDRYHGIDQLENDMYRQSVLERCGWKFVRVRASEFYYDRESTIDRIVEQINEIKNSILDSSYVENNFGVEETESIYSSEMTDANEIGKANNEIYTESSDSKIIADETFNEMIKSSNVEIKNKEVLDKNQFRYMVLYSEGVNINKIAQYYCVSKSKLIDSLDDIIDIYGKETIDQCSETFKKQFQSTPKYKNIYECYKTK